MYYNITKSLFPCITKIAIIISISKYSTTPVRKKNVTGFTAYDIVSNKTIINIE